MTAKPRHDRSLSPADDPELVEEDASALSPMTPSSVSELEARAAPDDDPSVAPDELGARYLRRAVQQEQREASTEPLPVGEIPSSSAGEQELMRSLVREFGQEGGLITHLPSASDTERDVSDVCREAIIDARANGAQTDQEVHQAAREFILQRAEALRQGR